MHFGEFPFYHFLVKRKVELEGESINWFIFSKKKNVILGNVKSFHSAKFRFTFTHVYIHASLNLNINLQSLDLGLRYLIIYKNI